MSDNSRPHVIEELVDPGADFARPDSLVRDQPISPAAAKRQLQWSVLLLAGWTRITPAGRIEDTLLLVDEEILMLEDVVAQYPIGAEAAAELIARWRRFRAAMQLKPR